MQKTTTAGTMGIATLLVNNMTTIYATRDGQERYDTVRPEMVAKTIKLLQRQGWLHIRVIPVDKSLTG